MWGVTPKLKRVQSHFRPHRMREILTVVTDDPVAWCVCQSVKRLRPAKTTARIEVLFEAETPGAK